MEVIDTHTPTGERNILTYKELLISELEDLLLNCVQKQISKIYELLLRWSTEEEMVKTTVVKWAMNVNKELMMASWEFLWKISFKISTCVKVQENNFKMRYRWHITPKKLSYSSVSNLCWKCWNSEGSS